MVTLKCVWRDYYEPSAEQARKLVMSGSSVFLQGFGGTGRTYATKLIVKELLEAKKCMLYCLYSHGQPEYSDAGRNQRDLASLSAPNAWF